jgi:hypothetical protein
MKKYKIHFILMTILLTAFLFSCSSDSWWNSTNTTWALTTDKNSNSDVEKINLSYTSSWLSSDVNVKKWKSYKIVIDVKDTITWCMSKILIPKLDENTQALLAWTQVTFNIKPTESGKFPLTCAMWIPHWYINVE